MAKEILMIGIGYTALFIAIFLVVYGAMSDNSGLFSTGLSIISFAFGTVMKELFPEITSTINTLLNKKKK